MATTTPTRAKNPKIVAESQKVFGLVKGLFVILFLVFLVAWVITWVDEKNDSQGPSWQLCWEKTNGVSRRLEAIVINRDDKNLTVLYLGGKNGAGFLEGLSSDGRIYDGAWRDPGGWGRFQLRFVSLTLAIGWVDEKGERPIHLWLTAEPQQRRADR